MATITFENIAPPLSLGDSWRVSYRKKGSTAPYTVSSGHTTDPFTVTTTDEGPANCFVYSDHSYNITYDSTGGIYTITLGEITPISTVICNFLNSDYIIVDNNKFRIDNLTEISPGIWRYDNFLTPAPDEYVNTAAMPVYSPPPSPVNSANIVMYYGYNLEIDPQYEGVIERFCANGTTYSDTFTWQSTPDHAEHLIFNNGNHIAFNNGNLIAI